MKPRRFPRLFHLGLAALALAAGLACRGPQASAPPYPAPTYRIATGEHGLLLAEVVHLCTRAEILGGQGSYGRWYPALLKAGIREEEIQDGRWVLARTQVYWINTSSPPRETLFLVPVGAGLDVGAMEFGPCRAGDVVEVDMVAGDPGREGLGILSRIREKRPILKENPCPRMPPLERHWYQRSVAFGFEKVANLVNPNGGSSALCLTGKDLEGEGWVRVYGGFPGGGAFHWWKPLPGARTSTP